ncbi:MAG: HAMP domain-containing sensor histidine kinase [Planctomycetota bacterium]
MIERKSLRAPITLGVTIIVLVVALAAVLVAASVLGLRANLAETAIFWIVVGTGTALLTATLIAAIAYLTLTVKAVNLNRRQSNFIDAVTHELKSPIASLKLYLQTMGRRSVEPQQQKDFHRFMLEDVERLDSLINHLLDAARVERGLSDDSATDVNLGKLLIQCGSAACLRYGVSADTVSVQGDETILHSRPAQLEILFRNLIDNAVKYGGSPPEVVVEHHRIAGRKVKVTVTDNGPGIPANQRRQVFARFVRLGSELERQVAGTGLGLHLARVITKALGGSIRVGDRGDETGTRFTVILDGVVEMNDKLETKPSFKGNT